MQFAILDHPNNLEQIRVTYRWLQKIPDNMLTRFLPYLPPVDAKMMTTNDGSLGRVVICPLLPEHFESLALGVINRKINSCIKRSEKSGAQVIGLEGLLGFCFEEGLLELKQHNVWLTAGRILRTIALLNKARITVERSGGSWANSNIVLAGALGQEGETWIRLLAEEVKTLTLLQTNAGWDKGFANRIVYETGLALKVSTDHKRVLGQGDVIFFHHLRPEDIGSSHTFKPGALVCSILPYSGWREALKDRGDIRFLDNPLYKPTVTNSHSDSYPNPWGYSTTIVETLILGWEQIDELICISKDITIKQVKLMSRLVDKYGFQLY